jgi:hypothetical protein
MSERYVRKDTLFRTVAVARLIKYNAATSKGAPRKRAQIVLKGKYGNATLDFHTELAAEEWLDEHHFKDLQGYNNDTPIPTLPITKEQTILNQLQIKVKEGLEKKSKGETNGN